MGGFGTRKFSGLGCSLAKQEHGPTKSGAEQEKRRRRGHWSSARAYGERESHSVAGEGIPGGIEGLHRCVEGVGMTSECAGEQIDTEEFDDGGRGFTWDGEVVATLRKNLEGKIESCKISVVEVEEEAGGGKGFAASKSIRDGTGENGLRVKVSAVVEELKETPSARAIAQADDSRRMRKTGSIATTRGESRNICSEVASWRADRRHSDPY
jgi:hypothetical protein